MAIVRSFGSVQAVTPDTSPWVSSSGGSLSLYGAEAHTYAAIYRAQPNVRTVVDFLARNIAQLGLHVFRRVSETDRERLTRHQLAQWIKDPNPGTTRYRLIESLMQDLGIYFNAYWLKVRTDERVGLLRLPPDQMTVKGGLLPTGFVWTSRNGAVRDFVPTEVVHFGGFDPENPLMGLSPLETLRRVLAEEAAAGEFRQQYWANAGRFEGVIERPATAPKWTPDQKKSWRDQWQTAYGSGGARPGSVAVLEDGMVLKQASFSAKDSEYLASRKLTREECAAAYHVPLPMVGILDHATFSNIKEQHKHLYQDCLGPWLVMIEEEIERQLLPETDDARDVYVEFNIAEKLKGSFEEQAAALQSLTGRPLMTGNEGRSRLNLPRHPDPDMDQVAKQQGGPAAADAAASTPVNEPRRAGPDDDEAVAAVLQASRARQTARLAKVSPDDRALTFETNLARWDRELTADLTPLVGDADAARLAFIYNRDMLARLLAEADHA